MAKQKKAVQKTRRVRRTNSSGETVFVNETYTDWVTDTSSSSCDTSSSYDGGSSSASCD